MFFIQTVLFEKALELFMSFQDIKDKTISEGTQRLGSLYWFAYFVYDKVRRSENFICLRV